MCALGAWGLALESGAGQMLNWAAAARSWAGLGVLDGCAEQPKPTPLFHPGGITSRAMLQPKCGRAGRWFPTFLSPPHSSQRPHHQRPFPSLPTNGLFQEDCGSWASPAFLRCLRRPYRGCFQLFGLSPVLGRLHPPSHPSLPRNRHPISSKMRFRESIGPPSIQ